MSRDKSILEKFTDTVKEMANSASEALKVEEPPKVEQTNAAYMPFAAEGLVSDPLLVPPIAVEPKRKRTAKRAAKRVSGRKAVTKRAAPRKARKAAKTSARGKSKATPRRAARASSSRTKATSRRKAAKRTSRKRSRR